MIRRLAVLVVLIYCGAGCGPVSGNEVNQHREERNNRRKAVDGGSFYFIQLTDAHWGARDGVTQTRQAVAMINALPVKVEFVAVTGDIFSDSIRREDVREDGLDAMKGLKVPVYYLPGNHDLMPSDMARTTGLFEKYFGPLTRKVEVCGVTCLFSCTEMREGETRHPGEVERDWVEKMLEGSGAVKPVLLFMHRPPLHDMLNGSDGEVSWDNPYDTRWEELFVRHPEIKAVFAGHFHRDVMTWIGSVPVYVSAALARFWDRQPSFRLYQYQGGRINYWTLYPERSKDWAAR